MSESATLSPYRAVERGELELALFQSLEEFRRVEGELFRVQTESARLMRITTAIADAVTPEDAFRAIVDETAEVVGASGVGLFILDEARAMRPVRSLGQPENAYFQAEPAPLDSERRTPEIDTIARDAPIWFESKEDLIERYPHLAARTGPGRSYAAAFLPLRRPGRAYGVLAVTFGDAARLDEWRKTFLILVARRGGQALERLELLETERRYREHLERLHRDTHEARVRAELLHSLAAKVLEAQHVEAVLDAAVDAVQRVLATPRVAAFAFDPDGVVQFRTHRGTSERIQRWAEDRRPWGGEAHGFEPVVIADVERNPSLRTLLPILREERVGAITFVPLAASGKLLGQFIALCDGKRELSEAELEMARTIACHAAAALVRFEAVRQLHQVVRFNEMFTTILGHDLRNPLAAIMTAAQLVLKREDDERVSKPLGRILSSGKRMARMIDQLLDFARLRTGGGVPIDPKPVELESLVKHVVDEVKDANPERTLLFTFAGDTRGEWDPDRLWQLFSNLVGNAVRHGILETEVAVHVDGTNADVVSVSVHNGGAISAEQLPNLFDPLMNARGRREKSEGLGLGLFISRQITRAHGGRIDAQSSMETGTTFTVALPRLAAGGRGAGPA